MLSFEEVKVRFDSEGVVGRVLTLLDAAFTDPEQRNAVKSLARQALRDFLENCRSNEPTKNAEGTGRVIDVKEASSSSSEPEYADPNHWICPYVHLCLGKLEDILILGLGGGPTQERDILWSEFVDIIAGTFEVAEVPEPFHFYETMRRR